MAELAGDTAVISALVIDELLYRMLLAWLSDDGNPDPLPAYRRNRALITKTMRPRLTRLWKALDRLNLELAVTDQAIIDRARQLLVRPGLAPATHSTPLMPSKPAATSSQAPTPTSTASTDSNGSRRPPDLNEVSS